MNKRLVSIICAAALFTQTLPTNAIATTIEDAFIKKGLNSEVDKLVNNLKRIYQKKLQKKQCIL